MKLALECRHLSVMCVKTSASLSLSDSFKFSLWSYLKANSFFVLGTVETSRNFCLATTRFISQNITISYFRYLINFSKKQLTLVTRIFSA